MKKLYNMDFRYYIILIIKMVIMNIFKDLLFQVISYLEKNYNCTDIKNLVFYGGIINEKLTVYLDSYFLLI